jgi:hypothetical protein
MSNDTTAPHPKLTEIYLRNIIGMRSQNSVQLQYLSPEQHSIIMKEPKLGTDGILVPYFDINGEEIEHFRTVTMESEGWRYKLTYRQRGGWCDRLYLPPILSWPEIAKDPTQHIVIYDAELDAIRSCQHGIPAVADRGIKEWKARRRAHLDTAISEDLAPFTQDERKFYFSHWHGDFGTLVIKPNWDQF